MFYVILCQTAGNLFMYIIGDLLSYHTVLWVCLAIPIVHITLFMFMPESPSFLIKKGKNEEAAKVLAWLRCRSETDSVVQRELERIEKEQTHDDESSEFVFKALLSVHSGMFVVCLFFCALFHAIDNMVSNPSEGSSVYGRKFTLTVFSYGSAIGWMSPMTLLLQSEKSPRGTPLSDTAVKIFVVSWMGALPYMVCIPSNFFMAYLGDRFGRKISIIYLGVVIICCWSLKLSSFEVWSFLTARALVGMIMSCYVTCPLYVKEISEDSIRGLLGSWVILCQTAGNLFMYIIGDLLSYHTVLWVCLAIPIVHITLFMFMPESPSFLIKKGKNEEAAKVLAWLRCRSETDSVVQRELERIEKEQTHDDESSEFVFKALFGDKLLRRAFVIVLVVTLARDLCGAIPVLGYAGDIFTNASKGTGLLLTPNQQAMMLGLVQVVGATIGSSVVEKSGRKMLLLITALVSGISMCVLASWFVARDFLIIWPGWVPIVTLCLCIFCDSLGLQPVSVVINAEMFSFKYRATVIASSMGAADVVAFLQMLFFKPTVASVGPYAAFFLFGLVCQSCAAYVFFVMPETKMRSIDEIYEDLKTKKEKRAEMESKAIESKI